MTNRLEELQIISYINENPRERYPTLSLNIQLEDVKYALKDDLIIQKCNL